MDVLSAEYVALSPLDRMRLQMPSLSKTQKKVAQYFLDHYDKAVFYTSLRISHNCSVSESSVIRLATTLGYDSFSQMQKELQELLKRQLSLSQRLSGTADNAARGDTLLQSAMKRNVESLHMAMMSLDEGAFQQAVQLLANAKRVFLFGSRSSYSMVYLLGLELRWVRHEVYVINGPTQEFDILSTITPEDVLLAISLPRYLRATTTAMENVHRKGVPTIAITDTVSSPLVPYAQVPLLVNSEIFSYSDNMVSIAALINALLSGVGAALRPESDRLLAEKDSFWDSYDLYLA